MNHSRIPVVFTPSESYMIPTVVAILSIMKNKKHDTQYIFYLVVSEKIDRRKLRYLEHIKEIYQGFFYDIIYINSEIFEKINSPFDRILTTTFYRLILHDILKEDTVIYLDGDVLVLDDLTDMYNSDMNNYYISGVSELNVVQKLKSNIVLKESLHIGELQEYICTGTLLMNLKKIREDNLGERFLQHMYYDYPMMDQDVLNVCCYGKIKRLPLKYGVCARWIKMNGGKDLPYALYSEDEIEKAENCPSIVHYAGPSKPWTNVECEHGEVWWEIAKSVLDNEEYKIWRERAALDTERRNIEYYDRIIKKLNAKGENKIVIYGAGKVGKELYYLLKKIGYQVTCIIDAQEKLYGNYIEECMIVSPELGVKKNENAIYFISPQNGKKEIRRKLLELGVEKEHIVDYFNTY